VKNYFAGIIALPFHLQRKQYTLPYKASTSVTKITKILSQMKVEIQVCGSLVLNLLPANQLRTINDVSLGSRRNLMIKR
jgi:hypothetical protein